jgi:hypothetical protein
MKVWECVSVSVDIEMYEKVNRRREKREMKRWKKIN